MWVCWPHCVFFLFSRSCTDVICCAIFAVFLFGYIIVGIVAWLYGDPRQVIYPRNSTGSYCGIGGNRDKPFLLYFNLIKCATTVNILAAAMNGLQCPTTQVGCCLAMGSPGPTRFPSFFSANVYQVQLDHLGPFVIPFLSKNLGINEVSNQGNEASLSFPHVKETKNKRGEMGGKDRNGGLWKAAEDVGQQRDNCGCPCQHCLLKAMPHEPSFFLHLFSLVIILCVVEVILLLTLLFLRKRIFIALALIREASRAIGHMMSTLFYPILTFILLVICVAYWGMTALYLATSGIPLYRLTAPNNTAPGCERISGNQSCNPLVSDCKCIFYKYNDEGLIQQNLFNLQIYNILGFLWCINFVIALGQCVLAGAFASYYWAFHKPRDIPLCAVCSAFIRTLRYHIGSLAFGALILTIVQVIRIILEYLDHKLKDSVNPVARCILCCLKCCFWCLEEFIKYLNRNAYIMIAIYGKNFCVSAKNAFKLLMRNVVRVVVLDKITDLLLLFGKLLVVGGVGVFAFFFFTGRIPIHDSRFQSPTLNYYWLPIFTVVVGSYLIAQGFFSVYSMCVDTLFLCFLEDLERNDGSSEKPYFMDKSLMKILNKKNKEG
uniref:Choline transporter-like protein n=1 Tax=Anolis carolinensis TaxID=28377 RepID=A0A803SM23_ANOCA